MRLLFRVPYIIEAAGMINAYLQPFFSAAVTQLHLKFTVSAYGIIFYMS